MSTGKASPAEGVTARHSKTCRDRDGGRCNCRPTYQANVWSNRDGKRVRRTFPTLGEAKAWRRDALTALASGTYSTPTATTVAQAADEFIAGARKGTIRQRGGDPFRPGTIRAYDKSLRRRVLPALGDYRLGELRTIDVQRFADALTVAPSTAQQTVSALRAVCRVAVRRGDLASNPCSGVEQRAVRNGRDHIVSPAEAAKLLHALPETERALWATAMFAGLRRSELQALRWEDVDIDRNIITVRRGWDPDVGVGDPKTAKGTRRVPLVAQLREYVVAHRLRTGGRGYVFGGDRVRRLDRAQDIADAAWEKARLARITPHDGRHTFASLMIASGVNAKALSEFMGHASIAITMDRYGHLMPGSHDEAADLLDAYLSRGGFTVAPTVARRP